MKNNRCDFFYLHITTHTHANTSKFKNRSALVGRQKFKPVFECIQFIRVNETVVQEVFMICGLRSQKN